MILKIRSNIEITEAIQTKIETQLKKLDKYPLINQNDTIAKVNIDVLPKSSEQKVTVTIPISSKLTLKASATDSMIYNALDQVIEKLEGQIKKNKTVHDKTHHKSVVENTMELLAKEDKDEEIEEYESDED